MRTEPHREHPILGGVAAVYRFAVSPLLHEVHRTLSGSAGACRFQPTCSEYAAAAFEVHGPMLGGWLAMKRVLRCHPFAKGGLDAVPLRKGYGDAVMVETKACVAPAKASSHLS